MKAVNHRLHLEMTSLYSQATVHIKKTDTKNMLVISLSENGNLYKLTENVSAVFVGKKPDGKIVFNYCDIEGDTITYTITAQTSVAVGVVDCELRLYDVNNNLLTSPRFAVVVDEIIYNPDDVQLESENEILVLDSLIAEAQALIRDVEERLANGDFIGETGAVGADGKSVTVESVTESNEDGGSNIVIFSDGTKLTVKNGSKGSDGDSGGVGKSAYEYARDGGYEGTEEEFSEMLAKSDERLETLEKKLDDALYEAIAITAFSNNVNTAEIGSVIDAVALAWTLSKTPVNLTLDGEALDINSEGVSLSGLGLTADKTWALTATDERGASASRNTSIKFLNGVYYGVLAEDATIDSATVLTLTRKLQSGKAITFTVTAGSTQRIAFALPARYGTPVFSVGGFEGGFELATTFDFVNGSGYTESYNVWLSSRTGLGNTTVSVK